MVARLTFLGLTAFWITMNVWLWRMEYGSQGGDTPVPISLIWRKILTAPDSSSLSVYQKHERTGYCEISTSVGQQMAALDENKIPPDGLAQHNGYQLHLTGNVSLGEFTNRLKFDGHIQFSQQREWQEISLKISAHAAVIEIHSFETNQSVHVKISNDADTFEHDLTFADLQNPETIIRTFAGNFADALLGATDLPAFSSDAENQKMAWSARRTRLKVGTESVPIYRLESSLLGRPILIDVSTLGEILQIRLPGDISAAIDELNKP